MNKLPQIFTSTARRSISTSAPVHGKRNFRKFLLYNKRGTNHFKEQRNAGAYPDLPIDKRGLKEPGIRNQKGEFKLVPELIPQIVVPDLKGFDLKPYVSYRAPEVYQSEFTPEDLFYSIYANKIIDDWNNKKINEDGTSKEPSSNELLDSYGAQQRARQTGSDIFKADKKNEQ